MLERPAARPRRRAPRCARGSARSRGCSTCCRRSQAVAAPVRRRLPGRRRRARRAARRAEPRPRPDGRGRRDRVRPRARRASWASRCHPHEKFQTAVVKGTRPRRRRGAPRRRERAHRVLRRARRAARGRALDAAARPGPARLHDQRDGDLAEGRGPRRHLRLLRRLSRPAQRAPCASCTTSASSRTRRGSCARSATRRGSASAWTGTPCRSRAGCIEMRLVGDLASARLRDELLDLLARAAGGPRRSSAWPSSASTARCTRASTPAPEARDAGRSAPAA